MATLHLNKPNLESKDRRTGPERLIGKMVQIQTRSPSHLTGRLESFSGGWVVIDGTERRWNPDGTLSDVVSTGRFTLDRSNLGYLLEVPHGA